MSPEPPSGKGIELLRACVISGGTAEAISVLFGSGILAQSFGGATVTAAEVTRALVGAIAKENADDVKVLREYVETVAKGRPGPWKELHAATKAHVRG